MKREFLKELELTDEAIDKIMTENGKDIEGFSLRCPRWKQSATV